jgi:hypothetical protein
VVRFFFDTGIVLEERSLPRVTTHIHLSSLRPSLHSFRHGMPAVGGLGMGGVLCLKRPVKAEAASLSGERKSAELEAARIDSSALRWVAFALPPMATQTHLLM